MFRYGSTLGFIALVACASGPISEAQRQQAERRLLAPFLVAREVGCGELRIELTGNFHGLVGRPAVDPARHRVETRRGDGYVETVWTNPTGLPEFAFVVTVGEPPQPGTKGWVQGPQTKFRTVQQVVLRTYEDRRPLLLNATAKGPALVQDRGAPLRELPQFVIADGAVLP